MKRVASVALWLLLAPSTAFAQSDLPSDASVERTGLEFKAPHSCPSTEEFQAKVQERAEGNEFVESDATRTFVVKIEMRGSAFHGSFRIRGGGTTKRKVSSESCIEVSNALAVVAALSLVPLNEEESAENSTTFVTTYGAADSSKAVVEENKLVPLDDETPQDSATDDSSNKKKGQGPLRNREREKDLKKQHTIGVDIQAGATLGRYPESVAARFDLSLRTAALLQISKNAEYLWGFIPRLRGNIQPLSRIRQSDYHVHISGFGFAAGGCYTPYYDPEGFRVFGCLDFGANRMIFDALPVPSDEFDDPVYLYSPPTWTGVGTLSLESEFKMVSIFYAALRIGLQQDTKGSFSVVPGGPDVEPITLSGTTFIASGGIGAHF